MTQRKGQLVGICLLAAVVMAILIHVRQYDELTIEEPSMASRCMYPGMSATPMTSGLAFDITRKLWKRRLDDEHLIVCAIHSYSLEMVGSMTYHDAGPEKSIFIVFIADKVLNRAPEKTLEFALAHENGHHALYIDLCGEQDDAKYVACEHVIDRYAANIVGDKAALEALAFFNELLKEDGNREHDEELLAERILLIQKEMLAKK